MSSVAIFGAGPIGSAIAQRLAERGRVGDILLVDGNGAVARGKALDIRQSGPIGGYDTQLSAAADPLAAVGADVIVLADDTATGPWTGDRGLGFLRDLTRAGTGAPLVFAAPEQTPLIDLAARELRIAGHRLVGTAAAAIPSIVASLLNIELGETGAAVAVAGRPPGFVVAWSAATIGGTLATERVAPHRLLAISRSLPRLWPPGPQAIAAPTALAVEGLVAGSRRLLPGVTILDGELGVTGRAGLLLLELGSGRVLRRVVPSMSPQERTEAITKISS